MGLTMPIAATGSHSHSPAKACRIRDLEQDLEQARRIGRWLSDDERAALALEQQELEQALEQQRQKRRKLLAVLVVSLLIPPLWPVAIALTLYLLFPATTLRLAVATGVSLLVLGGLVAVLITSLVVALLMALF
jgi:hypothetical protein